MSTSNFFSRALRLIALALIVGTVATSALQFRGILADRLCVDGIVAADGANMITNPEQHSAKCALMPPCIASGYTLLTKPAPGQTVFGPMLNLTAASNRKAVAYLRSLFFADETRANLEVSVEGVLTPAGELDITANIINDRGLTSPRYFTGYLADRECLDRIIGFDGANMMERPQDHTLHCMMIEICRTSGFSIHLPKNSTDPGYGAVYNFTAASHAVVEDWLRTLNYHRTDLYTRVYGEVNSAGLLELLVAPGSSNVTIVDLGKSAAAHVGVSAAVMLIFLIILSF